MKKSENIENSGNFKGSLQSSTESVMKRAHQYAMSFVIKQKSGASVK